MKGLKKVRRKLRLISGIILSETSKTLREKMELVITDAKLLCPVKIGTLRASGRAESKRKRSRVIVEGSFGRGPSGKYALYVHEGVGIGKRTGKYKVGQPKFLEEPFYRAESGLFSEVGSQVSVSLRSRL